MLQFLEEQSFCGAVLLWWSTIVVQCYYAAVLLYCSAIVLQCYCTAVIWKSSAMVMQCYSYLSNSAIDLQFCYEVAYRHTDLQRQY